MVGGWVVGYGGVVRSWGMVWGRSMVGGLAVSILWGWRVSISRGGGVAVARGGAGGVARSRVWGVARGRTVAVGWSLKQTSLTLANVVGIIVISYVHN